MAKIDREALKADLIKKEYDYMENKRKFQLEAEAINARIDAEIELNNKKIAAYDKKIEKAKIALLASEQKEMKDRIDPKKRAQKKRLDAAAMALLAIGGVDEVVEVVQAANASKKQAVEINKNVANEGAESYEIQDGVTYSAKDNTIYVPNKGGRD